MSKGKLFLLLELQCVQICIYFASTECWNFPLETQTSIKALLTIDNCLSQCSPGLLHGRQEELEVVNRPLQVPQPELRSVCLLPDAQVVRFLSGSLVHCARFHSSDKDTFVCGCRPNFCCYGWDKMMNVFHCHDADITLFYLFNQYGSLGTIHVQQSLCSNVIVHGT